MIMQSYGMIGRYFQLDRKYVFFTGNLFYLEQSIFYTYWEYFARTFCPRSTKFWTEIAEFVKIREESSRDAQRWIRATRSCTGILLQFVFLSNEMAS